MKAIEITATINESGQLTLDKSLGFIKPQRVRVIVLLSEDDETDPDETPTEVVIEGIRQGLHEALTGQTIPLSEMVKTQPLTPANKSQLGKRLRQIRAEIVSSGEQMFTQDELEKEIANRRGGLQETDT